MAHPDHNESFAFGTLPDSALCMSFLLLIFNLRILSVVNCNHKYSSLYRISKLRVSWGMPELALGVRSNGGFM